MELFKLFGKVVVDAAEAIKNLGNISDKANETGSKFTVAIGKIEETTKKVDDRTKNLMETFGELSNKATNQKTVLESLKDKYKDLYLTQGENSEEAKKCAEEIEKLSSELKQNKDKLNEASQAADKFDNTLEDVGKELEDVGQEADDAGDKVESSSGKMQTAFSKLGSVATVGAKLALAGIASVSAAFIGLGTIAVNYNAEMEQYQTSFEVMLGSQEEALKLVEDLKETAAATPFEMADLASTTQLLMNYGLEADAAKDSLMMLGDISQGSADKLQRIATAYGQMSSSGKVTMEDIKQMIEAGFNPLQAIADMTGDSLEEVTARYEEGQIAVEDITAAMEYATSEGGKYFQSMEKQSQTFTGRLSTLKDTINESLGKAFESVSGIMTDKVLPKLTELAETYIPQLGIVVEQLIPPIMQVAETALPLILSTVDMLLPMFVQFIEQMLPVLSTTLTTLLPVLLQMAQQILPVLLQVISDTVPELLPIITEILPILADLLMILLPPLAELLPQAVRILSEKIEGLADFIKIYVIPAVETLVEWFGPVLSAIFDNAGIVIQGFLDVFNGVIGSLIALVEYWIAIFTGDWEGAWQSAKDFFSGIWDALVGVLKMLFPDIIRIITENWDKISAFFSNAWTWCKEAFGKAKDFVTEIFDKIKDGITEKIESAVQFVKEGIEKLKGFFNFDWSLPKLKMPHFKISGSFSLDPPSVPSIGVDWYAKGGIMTEPTAFGFNPNTGNLMVGGEAGAEAIAPISTLQKYVAEAVASQNAELVEVLYKILAAILSMDGNMGANMREALAGTSLEVDRRAFARMVRAVN